MISDNISDRASEGKNNQNRHQKKYDANGWKEKNFGNEIVYDDFCKSIVFP